MKTADDIRNRNELPDVNFQDVNGNAFALMGHWRRQARRAGWSQVDIDSVLREAQSGDYDHLLQTLLKYSG